MTRAEKERAHYRARASEVVGALAAQLGLRVERVDAGRVQRWILHSPDGAEFSAGQCWRPGGWARLRVAAIAPRSQTTGHAYYYALDAALVATGCPREATVSLDRPTGALVDDLHRRFFAPALAALGRVGARMESDDALEERAAVTARELGAILGVEPERSMTQCTPHGQPKVCRADLGDHATAEVEVLPDPLGARAVRIALAVPVDTARAVLRALAEVSR